jgi:hypothetical protein
MAQKAELSQASRLPLVSEIQNHSPIPATSASA